MTTRISKHTTTTGDYDLLRSAAAAAADLQAPRCFFTSGRYDASREICSHMAYKSLPIDQLAGRIIQLNECSKKIKL